MAPLKVHGPVRMRSMQTGITKWKEGSFEIVEKDNKVSLVVHYNVGGIPKTFQVHQILRLLLEQCVGCAVPRTAVLFKAVKCHADFPLSPSLVPRFLNTDPFV